MAGDDRREKMKAAMKRLVKAALKADETIWYARRKSVLLNPTDDDDTDALLVELHEAVQGIEKLVDEGGDPDAQGP